MVLTLLNYLWIFVCAWTLGYISLKILKVEFGTHKAKWDIVLFFGIICSMIYSEIWSVFYRVGLLSNIVLGFIIIVGIIVFRGEVKKSLIDSKNFFVNAVLERNMRAIVFILVGICSVLYFAVRGLQVADFYDTSLYHIQAIKWIEKYGVVKGLGNLHFRFAYNSAFLPLQALFSWNSILGNSLHGMNSFIGLVAFGYAFYTLSIWQNEHFRVSDGIKLYLLFYVITVEYISSPNTDFFAMILILYVLARWLEELERDDLQKSDEQDIYSILALMAIAAVTVKMSAAMLCVLILKPFITYIKRHRIDDIAKYGVASCIIVIPYVVRNVLISGCLLYPLKFTLIKSLDWHMSESRIQYDHDEIIAYARHITDVNRYRVGFAEWFPEWFSGLTMGQVTLLLLNLILLIFFISIFIYKMVTQSKMNWDRILVILMMEIQNIFWFVSAPKIRYGQVFLYLIPVYVVSLLLMKQKRTENVVNIQYFVIGILFSLLVVSIPDNVSLLQQYGYCEGEVRGTNISESATIYVTADENQDVCGSLFFPVIPYTSTLDEIEMRGETFEDGFKLVNEYRDLKWW